MLWDVVDDMVVLWGADVWSKRVNDTRWLELVPCVCPGGERPGWALLERDREGSAVVAIWYWPYSGPDWVHPILEDWDGAGDDDEPPHWGALGLDAEDIKDVQRAIDHGYEFMFHPR